MTWHTPNDTEINKKYYIVNGQWTISKTFHHGKVMYSLYFKNKCKYRGTLEEAKSKYEELNEKSKDKRFSTTGR